MNKILTIPLIALRGTVVFPNATATIDVGREKSILALNAAIENDRDVFLVAQKDIAVADPAAKDIYTIGTVAKIKQMLKIQGDNMRLLVKGVSRAEILKYLPTKKYFEVDVIEIASTNNDTIRTEALLRKARELFVELGTANNKISKEVFFELSAITDPNAFINLASEHVFFSDTKKQKCLEITDTEERLEYLCVNLASELELAKLEKKINTKVKRQIDKGQKEYYLKEQIKAISDELGEGEDEANELERKIKESNLPQDVEAKALKELKRLTKMGPSSPDASVIRTYLEWITDLKWNTFTTDNTDLALAHRILDEDHYGLEKIKQRILEYLAVMQLTGGLKGPILCFVGPPGVGKTSIVKSIARCLGRKYVRMSLGGVRDEAEIRGHRRTYVGAIPGKIIYLLKQAQSSNPVMLFDEIDKMSNDFRGDPASAMLEVLDPEQNNSFADHYMEVPYDLSKVLFVATANTMDSIPAPLLDRMEIIELTGYTEEEKLEIARKFLLPKQAVHHGLKEDELKISELALRHIITQYTRESGVRSLEREIATIARKIALKKVNETEELTTVLPNQLSEYLGIEKYTNDILDSKDEIGSATGLAWTAVGGTTLTIDVTLYKGKGEIKLTGKLGDVMKESALTALSLVRSKAEEYGIDENIFATTDIHVHIPEGAIPKDGPSAGITLATAILSAFTKRPVSKKVAMTGEVTLRGKVLPIGGLKEKSLAAYRVGIRKIIIPKENAKDIAELPKDIVKELDFILSEDISTVFSNSLT